MSQSEIEVLHNRKSKEDNEKPPPKWLVELTRFVGLSLSKIFFRIKYIGMENIPADESRGLLICPNHQSFFDPFWVCFPVKRRVRYMAWDAATRWFLIGSFIRALGAFPVNLERGGKDALKISLTWLRSGGTLVIFPEGSRGFADAKLLPFKNGAVRIAMQAGVPILPVTIRGGNKVWSQDMKTPRLARVEIQYHPVFELPPAPEGKDSRQHIDDLTQKLAEIIESGLNEK